MRIKSFADYEAEVLRTASVKSGKEKEFLVCGLGIAGEAGEVADAIKKWIGHGHPFDQEKLKKELGDTLWYVARIAGLAGMTLEEVAGGNVEKLRKRYPDGFSTEASVARVDVK